MNNNNKNNLYKTDYSFYIAESIMKGCFNLISI